MLRGTALVMIYINHIPGTVWQHFTSRNFGFSDAAEGFVLISGIATGLAYGPIFLRGAALPTALRPWRRALTLWWVQLLVTAGILGLFALAQRQTAVAELAVARNVAPPLGDLQGFLAPLVLLGHQLQYADVLPLYVVLMIAAPGLLALAVRWPRALMAASLSLWLVAGLWHINIPTWPLHAGWSFDPLAWQVLFVAGILTGLAMRQGRRWLPVRRWACRCAWAFLILAAVWMLVPAVAAWGEHLLWLLREGAGWPPVLTSFDKSYVSLPRLLHILALAYLLSTLPAIRNLSESPRVSWLIIMGRHSLPVFATSTLLAYVGQVARATLPPSFLVDTALIWGGLAFLLLVAALRDGLPSRWWGAYLAGRSDQDHMPLASSPGLRIRADQDPALSTSAEI